jgi:hypothetical protein
VQIIIFIEEYILAVNTPVVNVVEFSMLQLFHGFKFYIKVGNSIYRIQFEEIFFEFSDASGSGCRRDARRSQAGSSLRGMTQKIKTPGLAETLIPPSFSLDGGPGAPNPPYEHAVTPGVDLLFPNNYMEPYDPEDPHGH